MDEELYQPVPAGTTRKFSPQQALNEIIKLVDPKFQVYFRTGTVKLRSGPLVSSEDRTLIRSLRNEVLSGGDVERVYNNINRFLTAGSTFRNNRAQVGAVLSGTRYVRPIEDPLGRGEDGVQPDEDLTIEEIARRNLERQRREDAAQEFIDSQSALYGDGTASEDDDSGTGDGGDGGTTFVYDREPAPVPVDWRTAAQQLYPEYLAIVEDNPEIGLLLEKAIEQGYDETRFAAELRGTTWWKTTTATAREWDLASGLDPASYQRRVDEASAEIQQEALNLGIRLSSENLAKLALQSQRLGWGAQRITNAIGMTAVEGGMEGTTQLREGYYGQQIRNVANQYGVSLAKTTFNSFVNKLAVGEETLGSFQDYVMAIGKSLYPSLSEQFDAGRTFDDVTSSYKNIAANILERDSNSIDMSSPEFVQAITYVPDSKTGEQRLMNMGEWGDYLRKTESLGYQNTTEARSRAFEVSNKIANMFGRV